MPRVKTNLPRIVPSQKTIHLYRFDKYIRIVFARLEMRRAQLSLLGKSRWRSCAKRGNGGARETGRRTRLVALAAVWAKCWTFAFLYAVLERESRIWSLSRRD